MITAICWTVFVLIVWFKTEAFVEYTSKLPFIKDLYHTAEYLQYKQDSQEELSFQEFLLKFYNSFFNRLLSCPICTGTWAGLFFTFATGGPLMAFPCVVIPALFLYYAFDKVSK